MVCFGTFLLVVVAYWLYSEWAIHRAERVVLAELCNGPAAGLPLKDRLGKRATWAMYPALGALEERGLVSSHDEPRPPPEGEPDDYWQPHKYMINRRVWTITSAGRIIAKAEA